jgi:hypothetical protein
MSLSLEFSGQRNLPIQLDMENVLRAHEWFDLVDEEYDQAVYCQPPEQNRFNQHIGHDLVVDGSGPFPNPAPW